MYIITKDMGDGENINIFSYPGSGEPMMFTDYEDAEDVAAKLCGDEAYEIVTVPDDFTSQLNT